MGTPRFLCCVTSTVSSSYTRGPTHPHHRELPKRVYHLGSVYKLQSNSLRYTGFPRVGRVPVCGVFSSQVSALRFVDEVWRAEKTIHVLELHTFCFRIKEKNDLVEP